MPLGQNTVEKAEGTRKCRSSLWGRLEKAQTFNHPTARHLFRSRGSSAFDWPHRGGLKDLGGKKKYLDPSERADQALVPAQGSVGDQSFTRPVDIERGKQSGRYNAQPAGDAPGSFPKAVPGNSRHEDKISKKRESI